MCHIIEADGLNFKAGDLAAHRNFQFDFMVLWTSYSGDLVKTNRGTVLADNLITLVKGADW